MSVLDEQTDKGNSFTKENTYDPTHELLYVNVNVFEPEQYCERFVDLGGGLVNIERAVFLLLTSPGFTKALQPRGDLMMLQRMTWNQVPQAKREATEALVLPHPWGTPAA